jgi:hypothetical protein
VAHPKNLAPPTLGKPCAAADRDLPGSVAICGTVTVERMKMHDGQVNIDADLVGRLVAAQFPQLSDLPISASEHRGRGLGAAVNLALLNAFRHHDATIAVVLPRGGVDV